MNFKRLVNFVLIIGVIICPLSHRTPCISGSDLLNCWIQKNPIVNSAVMNKVKTETITWDVVYHCSC